MNPVVRTFGVRGALLGAVLLLASGCAAVGAYSATSAGPPMPVREVLPNGVVLIAQEHRASDVVAVQLWMRMGGRDEAPDELGLAHYIEHMIFKGTPTYPPGSIDRLIEGFGGTSNAFTSYDTTHYDFVVPAEHLRATVALLADLAMNASFPPDEIEREKKVVFEEMNLVEDDPDKFLVRRLYEVAYAPHPYGRPLLGTREFIERLRRDQLLAFYRKHFVPKSMAVVVVGAVTPGEVRSAAVATFGRIPPGSAGRPELSPPPTIDRSRRVDIQRPEQQAYLGLAWKTAPTGSSLCRLTGNGSSVATRRAPCLCVRRRTCWPRSARTCNRSPARAIWLHGLACVRGTRRAPASGKAVARPKAINGCGPRWCRWPGQPVTAKGRTWPRNIGVWRVAGGRRKR